MKSDLILISCFIFMFLLGFGAAYFEKPDEPCFVIPPPEAQGISITTLRPIP